MRLARDFFLCKTTYLGVAAIIQALALYLGGSLSKPQLFAAVYAAFGMIFVRDTIAKAGEGPKDTTNV